MSRKIYYIKLFSNLYKKFIETLILKKNDNGSMYLLTKPINFYNLTFSLLNNSLTQFKVLNDICVIDYPEKTDRFELSYNVLSVKYNFRVFIKSYTSAYVPSLSSLFNSANWIERECWDMFGVFFTNHPDLRRILNMDDLGVHPMLKQYPLEDPNRVDKKDEYFGR